MPIKKKKSIKRGESEKRFVADRKIVYWLLLAIFVILLIIYFGYTKSKPVLGKKVSIGTGEAETASQAGEGSMVDKAKGYPPALAKAKLQLETINNVDTLKVVTEGKDKDSKPITYEYEWTKNSEPAGSVDSISGFKRGDKLAVKITPFDGEAYGPPRVLTTEIKNVPPRIIEHQETTFDGKILSYQVKATDPDGDPITYSLVDPPKGMTIDSASGMIKWPVDETVSAGTYGVKVKVSDGQGGENLYTININLGK